MAIGSKNDELRQRRLFSAVTNGRRSVPRQSDVFRLEQVAIHFDSAENLYDQWPAPVCIISDGPYGVSGFPGDEHKAETLVEWYQPHVRAWSARSTPQTTLWFWGTELGWATVHPLLESEGWEYRCCNIWDKGMSHVAGNANTQTLRKFPVVTEVCVHYVKSPRFPSGGSMLSMQDWLRSEWQRAGLAMRLANDACGVLNAATRKYLTADHLWYYPPVEAFVKLADYANRLGAPEGRPYFSLDGKVPIPAEVWATMRAKFRCEVGITNVWREPQVAGAERIQGNRNGMKYKFRSLHGSQKPLRFIELAVRASTDEGDVVWEPFGGLCPGAVVCHHLGRRYFWRRSGSRVLCRRDRKIGEFMSRQDQPSKPERELPDASWEHFVLYKNVREAIATLPVYFRTETHISGILATDLHTLNTVLGATIEEQVVRTLNLIRTSWDPDGRYALYSFMRQPQTFPDVRLRKVGSDETLLGLELKGWYLLAKEAEPSLRFQVTAAACAPADLIVVVPWVLGNVISGSPMLFEPFVESAQFAVAFRNYHWQHVRRTDTDTAIDAPVGAHPYPSKADQILDRPRSDGGGNFGRLARTGMMDLYMSKLNDLPLCGIKTVFWRDFLKAFQESTTDAQARAALERLRRRVVETADFPAPKAQATLAIIAELERLLDSHL